MKKNVTKIMLIGLAVATVLAFGACSKYKGFKKDKSGIYYQFYGDIHDTAAQPEVGGYVAVLMSMRAGDSTIIPMTPNQMLVDSLYEGDIFQAIRMMHVGDSATFILDGPMFYEKMMGGEAYPFGDEPIYFDIKLFGAMTKAEVEKAQAEYEAQLNERKAQEVTEIDKYLKENPGMKQTEMGVYLKSVKKGTGEKVEPLQTVKVHYTGKFTDGKVFDSSVDRGEPFKFTVGAGQVIPGWDATIADMKVGDKVTVLIPSDLAYGDGSMTYGSIPPYSPLVFDIELLEIVKE
jgi:FKBP-type peptidyl-prolyl cis-trans isomerase